MKYLFFLFLTLCMAVACRQGEEQYQKPSADHRATADAVGITDASDFDLMSLIEIPAGTIQKWEFSKGSNKLELEIIGDTYRHVNYIGYPGNYGMIPGTLQSKDQGGDGDPLDILILGPPLNRGDTVACRIIGVLKLKDQGEQDDKLIGVMKHTAFSNIFDIDQLDEAYPGVSEIINIWFENYKGKGKIKSAGFGSRAEAERIYEKALTKE